MKKQMYILVVPLLVVALLIGGIKAWQKNHTENSYVSMEELFYENKESYQHLSEIILKNDISFHIMDHGDNESERYHLSSEDIDSITTEHVKNYTEIIGAMEVLKLTEIVYDMSYGIVEFTPHGYLHESIAYRTTEPSADEFSTFTKIEDSWYSVYFALGDCTE